jgi:hypothetical protein
MIDDIKKSTLEFIEAQQKSEEVYFSFLRHLTTLCIGFLGLLIGLKPEKLPNHYSETLFFGTISSLSLGILFLTICIFYETKDARKEKDIRRQFVLDLINNPKENVFQSSQIPTDNRGIFQFIAFGLLVSSILFIITYTYFSTLTN